MEQISANDKYILPSGLSGVIVEDDAADVEQTSQQFDKQVEDSDPQTCCPAKVKSILWMTARKVVQLTRSLVSYKVELEPLLECVFVDVVLHSDPVHNMRWISANDIGARENFLRSIYVVANGVRPVPLRPTGHTKDGLLTAGYSRSYPRQKRDNCTNTCDYRRPWPWRRPQRQPFHWQVSATPSAETISALLFIFRFRFRYIILSICTNAGR